MDTLKFVIKALSAGIAIAFAIYGIAVTAKQVSYSLFYEEKVKQTIREMVPPQYRVDERKWGENR